MRHAMTRTPNGIITPEHPGGIIPARALRTPMPFSLLSVRAVRATGRRAAAASGFAWPDLPAGAAWTLYAETTLENAEGTETGTGATWLQHAGEQQQDGAAIPGVRSGWFQSPVNDHPLGRSTCHATSWLEGKGGGGGLTRLFTQEGSAPSGAVEAYYRGIFAVSGNYQGHSSGVNKTFWINSASQSNSITYSATGSGSGSLRPQFRTQVTGETPRNLGSNVDPYDGEGYTLPRGEPWAVVVHCVMNETAGEADGELHCWHAVGPDWAWEKTHEYTPSHEDGGICFAGSGQTQTFGRCGIEDIWGGVGDTVEEDMGRFFYHHSMHYRTA